MMTGVLTQKPSVTLAVTTQYNLHLWSTDPLPMSLKSVLADKTQLTPHQMFTLNCSVKKKKEGRFIYVTPKLFPSASQRK